MTFGYYELFDHEFYVFGIGKIDHVLSVQWLHTIGGYYINHKTMEFKFQSIRKDLLLGGLSNGSPRVVTTKRMEMYFLREQLAWAA